MAAEHRGYTDGRAEGKSGLLTPEEQQLALRIAHITLERYLGQGSVPAFEELGLEGHDVFLEKRAVFVTLHKQTELRGCIGHIEPFEPLWKSICSNAVSAAVHDRRFAPVAFDELSELELEVSVLTPPLPLDDPLSFRVGVEGIILEMPPYKAVFLPQVAQEQGWDQQTTLEHLCLKAGLDKQGWRGQHARFKVFKAQILK